MAVIKNKFLGGVLGNLIFKVVNRKQFNTLAIWQGYLQCISFELIFYNDFWHYASVLEKFFLIFGQRKCAAE